MEPNAVSRIVEILVQILVVIITPLATWLAMRVVNIWEAKTKIDVPERQEALLDEWIKKAISYAEEKARNASKNGLSRVTGPEKLETAADMVLDLVQQRGWVEWTRQKVRALIEAKLNTTRPPAAVPKPLPPLAA